MQTRDEVEGLHNRREFSQSLQNTDFPGFKCQLKRKKNWHTFFVTIFQVSADEGMGK